MAELQGQDPDNREFGSFVRHKNTLTTISPWSQQWAELELQRYEFGENGRTARRSVGDIHPSAQISPLDVWRLIFNPGEDSNSEPRILELSCRPVYCWTIWSAQIWAPTERRAGRIFYWNRIPIRKRRAISECLSRVPRSQSKYKYVRKSGLIAHLSTQQSRWRSCSRKIFVRPVIPSQPP